MPRGFIPGVGAKTVLPSLTGKGYEGHKNL